MRFLTFISNDVDAGQVLAGHYHIGLVALSYIPAVLSAFAALNLADRIFETRDSYVRYFWMVAGAVTMGIGIWSMHFIGMLAYKMFMPVFYDLSITVASLVPAIFASATALYVISRKGLTTRLLWIGGTLMGSGIGLMHYTGMAAMRMNADILYHPWLFLLSVVIAVSLATLSLYIKFSPIMGAAKSGKFSKLGSALIMGLAVTCMHYTAMTASNFYPSEQVHNIESFLNPIWLSILVGTGAFLIISLLIIATIADHEMTARKKLTIEMAKRVDVEKALKSSEERFRILYDNNPLMLLTIDHNCTILTINHKELSALGYLKDEIIGQPITLLCVEEEKSKAEATIKSFFNHPDQVHTLEKRMIRKDGSIFYVREVIRILNDMQGEPIALITCEDVTERQLMHEKLSYQASHDVLTDLINRSEFERQTQRLISDAILSNTVHALCFIDLDQFKVVNDTCGHAAGDALLCQVSELLKEVLRKHDTIARLGGDEFAILMEDCNLNDAFKVTTLVLDAIREFQFVWDNQRFRIAASIGLVPILPSNATNYTEVLKHADTACYIAKDKGRNRIHIFQIEDQETAQCQGEMQWVTRIQRALDENRFCLYAQPIECIRTGNRHHYELLVRKIDAEGKVIPPGAFLSSAERYNLISQLDFWVINHAFELMKDNPEFQHSIEFCSINLSGQSITDKNFLNAIISKFRQNALDTSKICFEITETAAISNLVTAGRFISELKGLGCKFALDDFGSGLSSFAYLKSLQVDFLKIDGMFVRDIVNDPIDFAMVKSINEVGQIVGVKTIAEFVENDAIKNKLKTIGVDYAQGYGIGKPMPIQELIDNEYYDQGSVIFSKDFSGHPAGKSQ